MPGQSQSHLPHPPEATPGPVHTQTCHIITEADVGELTEIGGEIVGTHINRPRNLLQRNLLTIMSVYVSKSLLQGRFMAFFLFPKHFTGLVSSR